MMPPRSYRCFYIETLTLLFISLSHEVTSRVAFDSRYNHNDFSSQNYHGVARQCPHIQVATCAELEVYASSHRTQCSCTYLDKTDHDNGGVRGEHPDSATYSQGTYICKTETGEVWCEGHLNPRENTLVKAELQQESRHPEYSHTVGANGSLHHGTTPVEALPAKEKEKFKMSSGSSKSTTTNLKAGRIVLLVACSGLVGAACVVTINQLFKRKDNKVPTQVNREALDLPCYTDDDCPKDDDEIKSDSSEPVQRVELAAFA